MNEAHPHMTSIILRARKMAVKEVPAYSLHFKDEFQKTLSFLGYNSKYIDGIHAMTKVNRYSVVTPECLMDC